MEFLVALIEVSLMAIGIVAILRIIDRAVAPRLQRRNDVRPEDGEA